MCHPSIENSKLLQLVQGASILSGKFVSVFEATKTRVLIKYSEVWQDNSII